MKKRKKVFVHLDAGRGYSRDILQGIYAYNNAVSGWEIIYEPVYFLRSDANSNNLSIINSIKPDGCILEFSENMQHLLDLNIPVIQLTAVNEIPDIPFVSGNYESDGRIAAEYFRRKGFNNTAFFGLKNLRWSETRLENFKKQSLELGNTFYSFLLQGNEKDVLTNNFDALINWLKTLPKPIGILCCNDNFGQILINSCSIAGISVPHDIAILGIDNDELICNITYPNLYSITRNHKKIAFYICDLISKMIEG